VGKIKKIKEGRKEEKLKRMKMRESRIKYSKKAVSILVLATVIFFLGSFGYERYGKQFVSKRTKKQEVSQEKPQEKKEKKYDKAPEMVIDKNKKYLANFETNKGNFKIELFTDKAPKTVNNFIVLSRDGFYDGLVFHRVIKDFMIQGGDPKGDGTGNPGFKFEDEINDIKLERGILAMANSGPNTNGSQFFIVTKDNTDWLDGKHTVFGRVSEGLEVVMAIEKLEVGENDKPKNEIRINKITIEEK